MYKKIFHLVPVFAILSLFLLTQIAISSELVPLYPKGHKKQNTADNRLQFPSQPTDPLLAIQHVDENAEYYLGSGAADDTFFITFEPSAPCSVYFAEIQWFDAGNINAFAAYYSDDAYAMYPDGTAPDRGTSPVSPIGQWIAGPVPNSSSGTQDWEILDLGGAAFIIGDPVTMQTEIFGVGYIKGSEIPHPLADRMDSKGIRYTYTWFGGPWMSTYPHDWGAYSSDLTSGTVIDLMMRVWVNYLWGMPILISNVSQHCNTFNYEGPYTITCELLDDDPGITGDDDVAVVYTVDSGPEFSVPLSETAPGSGVFSADIPGQPIGSDIEYRVFCVDETGLESESFPMNFSILAPENPDADLLLLNEGLADRLTAYTWALDELEVSYEMWDVEENNGFDESVIEYGWNSILAAGWGISSIPALDEPNPFTDFLDNGGNLALIDQDWFYAQSLPQEGTFISGDFGYDYMGVNEYWNDYGAPDENYFGQAGDPLTSPWANSPYETYWDETGIHMNPANQWADWFSEAAAENIFYGEDDGNSYGCRYDNGTFKTVFMSFMAEANCAIGPTGYWEPSDDFTQLFTNIIDWFDVPFTPPVNQIEVSLTPFNPPIYIPESGGSFSFNIALSNQTITGQTTDLWTEIELPGIGTVGPLLSVENLFIPPNSNMDRDRSQTVPAAAPAGDYVYYAYFGDLPWVVEGYDTFEFYKLGSDNCLDLGSLEDWTCSGPSFDELTAQPIIVESFRLNEPFPNPFNPETILRYELPNDCKVLLTVFDIQGREAASLVDGYRNAGVHEIVFDASSLSSGVYFAVIKAGDFNQTRKLLLIK